MTGESTGPTLAVFASDTGPGDAERASMMTQAGTYFARRGARLLCVGEGGRVPVPLISAARAVGGAVSIVADASVRMPPALQGVPVEIVAEREARLRAIAERTDYFVALPGSLATATSLFHCWTAARQAGLKRPVVLLNRNRAFEVLRGYSADVLSHTLPDFDRVMLFADSVEDVWIHIAHLMEG
jgi:predicted Rossmann-fold nucleotide-binding protein